MFENNSTVEYMVSGANSLNVNSQENINTIPSGSLKFRWPQQKDYTNGGFLMIQADPLNLTINFIVTSRKTFFGIPYGSYTTKILYSKVILPRV